MSISLFLDLAASVMWISATLDLGASVMCISAFSDLGVSLPAGISVGLGGGAGCKGECI